MYINLQLNPLLSQVNPLFLGRRLRGIIGIEISDEVFYETDLVLDDPGCAVEQPVEPVQIQLEDEVDSDSLAVHDGFISFDMDISQQREEGAWQPGVDVGAFISRARGWPGLCYDSCGVRRRVVCTHVHEYIAPGHD